MLCCGFVVFGLVLAVVVCMCVRVWWGFGVFRQNLPTTTILGRRLSLQESRTTIRTPTNPITTQGPHKTCPHAIAPPPKKNIFCCPRAATGRTVSIVALAVNIYIDEANVFTEANVFKVSPRSDPHFTGDGCHCSMVIGSGCVLSLCLALWWLCNGGEWCSIKACPGFSPAVST